MPTDYGRLAKRISAITTNCLLSAIVLVAGLGFGRQVLRWWAEDAEPAGAMPLGPIVDGLGDPARLHVIEFGDRSWSIRRQSIAGDNEAAAAALRALCREVLGQGRLPDQAAGGDDELLSRLAAQQPVEEQPGQWRLYALDEAFPMVIGTQPAGSAGEPADETNLAPAADRMVVWGVALPVGPEAWTLMSFQPEGSAGPEGDLPVELPIPAGCRRTLCVRVAGGGAAAGFEAARSVESCIEFYEGWFASRGWHSKAGWERFGQRCHVRYAPAGQHGAGPPPVFVDVHLSGRESGSISGLLLVTPSASGSGG